MPEKWQELTLCLIMLAFGSQITAEISDLNRDAGLDRYSLETGIS